MSAMREEEAPKPPAGAGGERDEGEGDGEREKDTLGKHSKREGRGAGGKKLAHAQCSSERCRAVEVALGVRVLVGSEQSSRRWRSGCAREVAVCPGLSCSGEIGRDRVAV